MSEKEMQGGQSIQEQYKEMGERKKNAKKLSTKVKGHLKRHKTKYIVGGVGLTAGVGIGYYLHMRFGIDTSNSDKFVTENVNKVTTASMLAWKPVTTSTTNNTTNIFTKLGHPGNKIMCNETKELFDSQTEASKVMGLNPTKLSNHLNGKKATVGGYTFTKMIPEESS